VYLLRACDSPANAAIKLASVFEPFNSMVNDLVVDYELITKFDDSKG
jgi:hypothetical protein